MLRLRRGRGGRGERVVYVPDEEAALQIELFARAVDPQLAAQAFPGWDPAGGCVALVLPAAGGFCLARAPWEIGRPVAGRQGEPLPGLRHVGAEEAAAFAFPGPLAPPPPGEDGGAVASYRRTPVVLVPPAAGAAEQAARVFSSLFRVWFTARPGRALPPAPPLAETAEATAMAAVEGRLLLAALGAQPDVSALQRLLTQIALVRRERRSATEPEEEAEELALEAGLGLGRYVGGLCARRLAEGPVPPADLVAALADAAALPPARRLAHTGHALALLLQAVEGLGKDLPVQGRRPWAGGTDVSGGWRAAVAAGATLDALLESRVRFDGGSRDDALLTSALAAHDHAAALERARAAAALAEQARRALVEGILTGPGTLLSIDIRALGHPLVRTPAPAQPVHAGLLVYPEGAEFSFAHGTHLRFAGLAVAADGGSGLLQARVPARLRLGADGAALPGEEAAAFTDGLQLNLPGVRLRARAGTLTPMEGGYLLRLLR